MKISKRLKFILILLVLLTISFLAYQEHLSNENKNPLDQIIDQLR